MSDHPEQDIPPRLADAGLTAAAHEARRQLAGPLAPLIARIIGADPLLAFSGQLARLREAQGSTVSLHDGQFVTADGRYGILFLATRHSAFDATRQRPFLQETIAALILLR